MDIATAAKDAGGGVLVLVIVVAASLVFILASLLWWVFKERMAERRRKDALTERRLDGGNKRFENHETRLDDHEARFISLTKELMTKNEFITYCTSHEKEHNKIAEELYQISLITNRMEGKLDEQYKSIMNIFKNCVTIGPPVKSTKGKRND